MMSYASGLLVIVASWLSVTLVDVVWAVVSISAMLLAMLVGVSVSWMRLLDVVSKGIGWTISICGLSFSFPLVQVMVAGSLRWIAVSSWSTVRGSSVWVAGNAAWLVNQSSAVARGMIVAVCFSVTLVDVMTSIVSMSSELLTMLVRASMAWMGLMDIVSVRHNWTITVGWFSLSIPLVEVMGAISVGWIAISSWSSVRRASVWVMSNAAWPVEAGLGFSRCHSE